MKHFLKIGIMGLNLKLVNIIKRKVIMGGMVQIFAMNMNLKTQNLTPMHGVITVNFIKINVMVKLLNLDVSTLKNKYNTRINSDHAIKRCVSGYA